MGIEIGGGVEVLKPQLVEESKGWPKSMLDVGDKELRAPEDEITSLLGIG